VLGTELFEQADRHEHETTKGHDETADDHEEDLRGRNQGSLEVIRRQSRGAIKVITRRI
jgi:hypothetical protein